MTYSPSVWISTLTRWEHDLIRTRRHRIFHFWLNFFLIFFGFFLFENFKFRPRTLDEQLSLHPKSTGVQQYQRPFTFYFYLLPVAAFSPFPSHRSLLPYWCYIENRYTAVLGFTSWGNERVTLHARHLHESVCGDLAGIPPGVSACAASIVGRSRQVR